VGLNRLYHRGQFRQVFVPGKRIYLKITLGFEQQAVSQANYKKGVLESDIWSDRFGQGQQGIERATLNVVRVEVVISGRKLLQCGRQGNRFPVDGCFPISRLGVDGDANGPIGIAETGRRRGCDAPDCRRIPDPNGIPTLTAPGIADSNGVISRRQALNPVMYLASCLLVLKRRYATGCYHPCCTTRCAAAIGVFAVERKKKIRYPYSCCIACYATLPDGYGDREQGIRKCDGRNAVRSLFGTPFILAVCAIYRCH